jgi:hypothetical protein
MDRVGPFPFLSRWQASETAQKTVFVVRLAREPEVAEHIRPILRDEANQRFSEYSWEYGYRYLIDG